MATRNTPQDAPENWAGKPALTGKLLDGVAALDDGEWVDVENYAPLSFHISGIGTATVELRGSNAASKPANGAHEIKLGSDITADGIRTLTAPIRWVKARITAHSSGTITVDFLGHGRG